MKKKSKSERLLLVVESDVVRQIRQHARSQIKTEVCGVLIGFKRDNTIRIEAAIQGVNAAQAGTHVTFTQDTWEHVYKIKDKEYPDSRIVGWYHSHPGFGVFLSDHDSFIHRNFFSSPDQVAWVYDPHTDEEGCFAWVGDSLERVTSVEVHDPKGGELVDTNPKPEPSFIRQDDSEEQFATSQQDSNLHRDAEEKFEEVAWLRWISVILSHVAALLLGFFVAWYVFPRIMLVPVDPNTGQPLMKFMEQSRPGQDPTQQRPDAASVPKDIPGGQPSSSSGAKGSDGQRK
jgi:proteasome lid subunit RPN8/RPN11